MGKNGGAAVSICFFSWDLFVHLSPGDISFGRTATKAVWSVFSVLSMMHLCTKLEWGPSLKMGVLQPMCTEFRMPEVTGFAVSS